MNASSEGILQSLQCLMVPSNKNGTHSALRESSHRGPEGRIGTPQRGTAEDDLPVRSFAMPARVLRVLLVDDSAIHRVVARAILTQAGCNVIEVNDGFEAVKIAQTNRFDAILMDVCMPVLGGIAAAQLIRESGGSSCKAPIFAVTGNVLAHESAQFKRTGISETLIKPLSPQMVQRILSRVRGTSSNGSVKSERA